MGHPTFQRRNLLAFALLFLIMLMASLLLARDPHGVASVWLASGLAIGWLLSRQTRQWPAYLGVVLLVELAGRALVRDPWASSLAYALTDLLEALIVAGMIRRRVSDVNDPKSWAGLGLLATLTTLVACAASAVVAAGVAALTGANVVDTLVVWYPAHFIGIVLVATLTLIALRQKGDLLGRRGRRAGFALSMLVIAVVTAAIFAQSRYPVLFLAFPPLVWAAFQYRFAGVISGVVVLALISSVATWQGHGPIESAASGSPAAHYFVLQSFIAAACLLTFPVALAMAERSRLAARSRQSEAEYRMLADYSLDLVIRMDRQGRRLYVSPSAFDVLGWRPEELLARTDSLVHPDEVEAHREAIARLVAHGPPFRGNLRLLHRDGHYVWVEATVQLIPALGDDGQMDLVYASRDIGERIATQQLLDDKQRELEQLARVDPLTGLANRRQFDERLALAIARNRRHGAPLALLYLDIDHFKTINDTFGHLVGDQVLAQVARRLTQCVRAGDLVARMGGDEFVILVDDAATADAAEAVARKLVQAMLAAMAVDGAWLSPTASIGVAFAAGPSDAAELMLHADRALYAAKAAGRGRYSLTTVTSG